MKTISIIPLLTVIVAAAGEDPSYLTWMANSYMTRGLEPSDSYSHATLYLGFEKAYDLTQDETYLDWYRGQYDDVVLLNNGSIIGWNLSHYSLDNYRLANNMMYWYDVTGEEKYKIPMDTIREQLNRHPRTPSGGFWHREPDYPNQMWLDGIFMADSFYAKWTARYDADNQTAWDDIVLQYDLIEEHTRNKTTGLLAHGYDESKVAVWADPVTGSAPLVWSRAVGWYFLSLLEVLEVFPQSHPGYERLLGYYTWLAEALKTSQDPGSGGWWLIMSEEYVGAEGNYVESSGTAMFTYGWFKGIRDGHLEEVEYLEVAKKAYEGMTSRFLEPEEDGTLTWHGTVEVGSLSSNGTFEYYTGVPTVPNDVKGAGPFMLAAYEWETWAKEAGN